MQRPSEGLIYNYIRSAADKLRLRDWDIAYMVHEQPEAHKDPDQETYASVVPTYGTSADIRLSDSFFRLGATDQRRILIHELCHLHAHMFHHVAEQVEKALEESPEGKEMLRHILTEAEEHAVDQFARILAPSFPLPPWTGKNR